MSGGEYSRTASTVPPEDNVSMALQLPKPSLHRESGPGVAQIGEERVIAAIHII